MKRIFSIIALLLLSLCYSYGARSYNPITLRWTTQDPMAEKYYRYSPYTYCVNNPIRFVDPNGMDWKDAKGNIINNHKNIKVYIFYDPYSFKNQSIQMYYDAIKKYGEGSVALSDVVTETEFFIDWKNMAGEDIKEVNLNYHGNNQTLMLKSSQKQYITSSGDGETNRSESAATNVQDLPHPSGNIHNAQLNINSCKSNSKTQYKLKGNKQTLMMAFYNSFDFEVVRGTEYGVSYNKKTMHPFPGRSYRKRKWTYFKREVKYNFFLKDSPIQQREFLPFWLKNNLNK